MIRKLKEKKKISHKDAMKETGKLWNGLSEEEKKPYNEMHEKEKKRYEAQMKEFEKSGHFTLTDGTRSDKAQIGVKRKASKSAERKGSKRPH